MPNKFELRLLDLIEQHSNGKNEVSEHPRITSHNILLEVHDAITEPDKLLSYEKTVMAHERVKRYILNFDDAHIYVLDREKVELRLVE
ncbi:hypothetical protein [Pseudoalteromonas maricaloris]|uniref:hypothetical protein n=1 Tax=Pseudoalteromonas maricaloris TaxID=184924 RepID=UPI000B05B84B|nr:hypothetical protein [Pseudoalteromonas flavipulchra]MBD0781912.1 hypothetical protein [Pseudoalteromonas flavipulchra]MBE0373052.1 hypothetical protein [Pseudoalteromonas flavipulchra NCIMB 2033 = ATCC BAA-314]